MNRRMSLQVGALLGLAFATVFGNVIVADSISAREKDEGARCYLLEIEGMTCKTCATHVQKSLAKVPGVAKATVSYEKSEADVCTRPNSDVRTEELVKAVEKAGYKAKVKKTKQG